MKLKEIAIAYVAGDIDAAEAKEMIHALDLPVFDRDWDGKWAVQGDVENDHVSLTAMKHTGKLSKEHYREIMDMLPEDYEYKVSPTTLEEQMSKKSKR